MLTLGHLITTNTRAVGITMASTVQTSQAKACNLSLNLRHLEQMRRSRVRTIATTMYGLVKITKQAQARTGLRLELNSSVM